MEFLDAEEVDVFFKSPTSFWKLFEGFLINPLFSIEFKLWKFKESS